MAIWGDNKPDPKELIGLTREELEAKLAEGAEAKAKLTEIETQLTSGFDELRNSLAALKQGSNPQPQVNPNASAEPTPFWTDPDKAFSERSAPLANFTLGTAARVELLEARQRFSREFSLWGNEIQKIIDEQPNLALKANPQYYADVVAMVTGRHAKEIEDAAAKGRSIFTEPVSGGLPGGVTDNPKEAAVARLSKEELDAAKRFGMTPEQWVENAQYVSSNYGHTKGSSRVQ